MTTEVLIRIPREELDTALRSVISEHFARSVRLIDWRRRLSRYSSSCPIENLQVSVRPGGELRMVLKDSSPGSLMSTARKVRPHAIYDPMREIEIYRTTLRDLNLGTATCYGAICSDENGRYWLLLERVDGPLLWQVGAARMWAEAARWLARMHGRFDVERQTESNSRLAHLPRYNRTYLSMWRERANEFMGGDNAPGTPLQRRRFGKLMDRYDRVIETLLHLPFSLIHGEFYPSNVVVGRGKHGARICPIDWELAAVGPGALDLAALVSGEWSDDERAVMIKAYFDVACHHGNAISNLSEMKETVDFCRLHIAVQLLGWAVDWSPPKLHARNWLADALRIGGRIGL
ncbi:phosphotransferase [bacterium]|nr:phosphotransferase [bacterium]